MADFICSSLGRLGTLLQAAYDRRERCLARSEDMEAIRDAELILGRIHNLITRHRSSCPICRFHETVKPIPPRKDNPKVWRDSDQSGVTSRETGDTALGWRDHR